MPDLVPISAGPVLEPFARAGVLDASDVHVAKLLCRAGGESDETVALALAVSCRELRRGSVFWDPTTIVDQITRQILDPAVVAAAGRHDLERMEVFRTLVWPDAEKWLETLAASPVVGDANTPPNRLPARLDDGLVYLEKYWQAEQEVARDLARLAADPPLAGHETIDPARTRQVVEEVAATLSANGIRLDPAQAEAAARAIDHRVSVLAGGPGTGKTTTVCAMLAALRRADPGLGAIALSAPSGKAAARLRDSVAEVSSHMPRDLVPVVADATTVHSLLKWHGPGREFEYDRRRQLPFGVVVVDEASMLSLPLAASLLEAVGPGTRLVLVGDPGQLVSVDAGSVLADVVDSAHLLGGRPGRDLPVTILQRNHRSGGDIAELSEAVRTGRPDDALHILTRGGDITFVDADPATTPLTDLAGVVAAIRDSGGRMARAAAEGDDATALQLVDAHRLLCAHRRGPYGVDRWSEQMAGVLADVLPGLGQGHWVRGETAMATHNLAQMGVSNGDCGVIVESRPVPTVALPGPGGVPRRLPCSLISSLQPLQAMTIHKAQGSQFTDVTVVLPPPESPLLTRELFYTAITRARQHLTIVGTAESVERAIAGANDRRSGLQRRWEADNPRC